jgi:hypothetical protein
MSDIASMSLTYARWLGHSRPLMTTHQTKNAHRRDGTDGLTIRRLGEADASAVRELAARDSAPVPEGELLGLEVEGRLLAVKPLADDGAVIADPFARTADARELLDLRTAQLRTRARRHAQAGWSAGPARHRRHPVVPFARELTTSPQLIKETSQ